MSNPNSSSNNSGGFSSSSRVSSMIPTNVRKTIQHIKEITGNHSDDDIYAMLKECNMDPNETTQRLLHLDTFHEVKRKRDKRKENVKSRPAEEPRGKPAYHGRGPRGARGGSYSQYSSNDTGGRRNASIRKENVVGESREKGFKRPPAPISKETDPIQPLHVEKSLTVPLNGPVKLPNGSLSTGHDSQSSAGVGDTYLSEKNVDASADLSHMSKGSVQHAPSASDPVCVPSCDSQIPTAVGAIRREVQTQKISSESSEPCHTDRGVGTTDSISNSHLSKHELQNVDKSEASSSMIQTEDFGHVDKIHPPDRISAVKSSLPQGMEEVTLKMEKLKFSGGQHVIIPNHIQVPDAVKNVLSFGSLDASFRVRENYVNSESNKNSSPAVESTHHETTIQPSSCDDDTTSMVPEGNHVDQPPSPSHVSDRSLSSDPKLLSSPIIPEDDQLKEEALPAAGPPFPVVQTTPSYSFSFMPPNLVNPLVQPESQAHVSNTLTGSSPAISASSTPPPAQSAGAGQSSVAVTPQPIALFRQPYAPNYVPYGHYYPFYVPPTMHQYFSHTAFPPHLPPGNMYLPPPAAAAGMKISPSPYKPGASTGNQAPVGLPSTYGAYSSSQVGFSPIGSVTSGNSSNVEDLVPSVLKENNIFPGQQSEGSTVWFPTPGRDGVSIPLNTFLNLPPQGQHVMGPQSGPGAFVYHALQPMAAPAPGLTLVQHQQSQPMVGPVDTPGPPSNPYQQPPQRQQQVNWNM